jgi:coenzyme F420-reducing hydrogenase gamma subunit
VDVITSLLVGRVPRLPSYSVCMECKKRGTVCVMVARGLPCLGPLTQTGCGAICPAYNRGCYGCFGPLQAANADSLSAQLLKDGMRRGDLVRLLRGFTGFAEVFRSASDKWDKAA